MATPTTQRANYSANGFWGWVRSIAPDDEATIRHVRLFIEQHGESRFRRVELADERTIHNQAGCFDGETYFFSREVFKTEVCRGFDPTQAARALERRKCLETNHGLQFKRRDPEIRKPVSFYAVTAEILE